MKFIRLSTTSKLYLLVLLLIFGLLFLNDSVFAQDTQPTVSDKRLKTIKMYYSWVKDGGYGQFKSEQGKTILLKFESFLEKVIEEDQNCLKPLTPQKPTAFDNIISFFSSLVPLNQKPQEQPAPNTLSLCKEKIKQDYKLAKKYNRALKYLQIEDGQANICVKADLGVGRALKARGFNPAKANSDNPKETGVSEKLQVYLCTGNDGKKKVRVVDDSGTRLRLAPEDASKDEFKEENLPPEGSFEMLLEKLNIK